jgi:uncharacterized protein (TIGR02594 family)
MQFHHPIDFVRNELGQKEVQGSQDNPRIRHYFTHCTNIGSKEYPDEVPWCSALINTAAFESGYARTDSALASSWEHYGIDSGDLVDEGEIVVIKRADGGRHVTLANKAFNRRTDRTFEGIGGNQHDSVNVTTFKVSSITATRSWVLA